MNKILDKRPLKKVALPTTGDILEVLLDFSGRMDQKFEGIDEKFESIDQKFKKIDERFDKIETELIAIRTEITDMRNEIRHIWTKLDDIDGRLTRLERRTIEDSDSQGKSIVDLQVRVKTIEKHLAF